MPIRTSSAPASSRAASCSGGPEAQDHPLAPLGERLAGAQTDAHALPAIILDGQKHFGERLRPTIGLNPRFIPIVADITAVSEAARSIAGPLGQSGKPFCSNGVNRREAVATAFNRIFNWAVTRTFPLLAAAGLGIAYGIYAAFALLAALFIWKFLPETRGRTLS
jgi:sugar transport protein